MSKTAHIAIIFWLCTIQGLLWTTRQRIEKLELNRERMEQIIKLHTHDQQGTMSLYRVPEADLRP